MLVSESITAEAHLVTVDGGELVTYVALHDKRRCDLHEYAR
jgi:hypothetical protein